MPHKTSYNFSENVCKENADGDFLEVPISSYHRTILHVLADKICQYLGLKQHLTDGTHVRSNDSGYNDLVKKSHFLKKIFGSTRAMLSFSQTATISVFLQILLSRKHLLCAIDHPKDMSKLTIPGIRVAGLLCKSLLYKEIL